MRGWRFLVLVWAVAVTIPSAAQALSVRERDIGWPAALRSELRLPAVPTSDCRASFTGSMQRLQDRVDEHDPRDALYLIFHDRPTTNLWGNLWYDPCDAGRLHVGVASGGSAAETRRAVAQARRYLTMRHLAADVRLVAVRSTYRQLSDQVDALSPAFDDLLTSGLIGYGIDTSRNAVVVDVARPTTQADRDRLRAVAKQAPVSFIVHPVADYSLAVEPLRS